MYIQFDLQRMMIYCDSKHAELETCCDLPNGPVSITGQQAQSLRLCSESETRLSDAAAKPWRFLVA